MIGLSPVSSSTGGLGEKRFAGRLGESGFGAGKSGDSKE
jgi:hypothetical protein